MMGESAKDGRCIRNRKKKENNMIKKIILLPILLFIIGCAKSVDFDPMDYKCYNEQLYRMEKEFTVCRNTNYASIYCYEIAVKHNCTNIMDKQIEEEERLVNELVKKQKAD